MDEQLRLLVFLLFFDGRRMSCRCRPAGRLSALLSTGVRAQKLNLLALRAAERELCRLPAEPQGKMLAPRNGGTRLCRHRGANSAGDRQRSRAKCWRRAREAQGFAGNGAPTRPAAGPHSRAKCWRLATEAQGFAGTGAPTWPTGRGASGRNVGAA